MSVLDQLSEQETDAEEAAYEEYQTLVAQLANGGDDPELDHVTAVLAKAGRTSEQLRSDIYSRRHRDKLRGVVSDYQQALAERREIAATIGATKAELEAAQNNFQTVVYPLEIRLRDIDGMALPAADAERELQDPKRCPDKRLASRLDRVRSQLKVAGANAEQCRDEVQRLRDALVQERRRKRPGATSQWTRTGDELGGDPARSASLEKRLAAAEAKQDEAVARSTALFEQEAELMKLLQEV